MEFNDLHVQYEKIKSEVDLNINRVLQGGQFILGRSVAELEQRLADYVGVKHVVGCSSGTDALMLIYMAIGIGKGDAIFCPDMTFIASVESACLLGATPVFCDIDMCSYNISIESLTNQIEAVIKEGKLKPRAIIAVDFLGNPARYNELEKVAQKFGLLIIEDAAQSLGGSYKGKKCGSFGVAAATSFYPSKPLGCYGDGGAVFTNDDELYELIMSLRSHGKGIDKYHNVRVGINGRLDEIQAAILLPKLNILDNEIDLRQKVAKYYKHSVAELYYTPMTDEDTISTYAQYVLIPKTDICRDEIIKKLKNNLIPSILYYPVPLHKMEVFSGTDKYSEEFLNSSKYCRTHFAIPFSPYIEKKDLEKIVNILL